MSEYLRIEKPFLDQLAALGWTVIDQGQGCISSDPATSLRGSFREWLLPEVFRDAVRSLNRTASGTAWLTDASSTTCATKSCGRRTVACWKSTRGCRRCF